VTRITEPGIYPNMPAADYFADPCPQPSLTQSVAKLLIDRSPAHAWWHHPRLNPAFERNEDSKFSIGNVAHALLLGRGKDFVVVQADDWRSKAERDKRDEAQAAGKVAVLTEQHDRASQMAAVARQRLARLDIPLAQGAAEAVIAWREGALWFRAMLDWLAADCALILDYKTTAASASPLALPTKLVSDGWDVQAAMHERGLDVIDPSGAGRRRHIFLCQECDPPYALSVSELSESVMTMGRKKLAYAVDLWAACMRADDWPSYPGEVQRPAYPSHLEARWLAREMEEAA
jgi:hypothetical protein